MIAMRSFVFGLGLLALVACDNAQERADAHFEKGQTLAAAGETEKAILEFRNALRLNQEALEPRLAFARLLYQQGRLDQAVGNYLKVVELDPAHLEARLALARIMVLANQPEEATIHIDAALDAAPLDVTARGLKATLAYRDGQIDNALALANGILEDVPGEATATMVIASHEIENGRLDVALEALGTAIARSPGDLGLYLGKLRALEAADDQAGIGAHLRDMLQAFPDNPQVAEGLAEWHVRQDDLGGAEAVLRDRAAKLQDEPGYALAVVNFLRDRRGPDAARAELDRLVESGMHHGVFGRALAAFAASEGDLPTAIAQLRSLLAEDSLDASETREAQTELASYLMTSGEIADGAELAETVLKDDPSNAEALQLRAQAALAEDRPEAAISALRLALDSSPQDPAILMQLARAHLLNGSRGLAQERLALAVQASGGGVLESLAYAGFLADDDKLDIAEAVLIETLEQHGPHPDALAALARIRLGQSDWTGAEEAAIQLTAFAADNPEISQLADEIRAAAFAGQQKFEDSIGVLRQMWEETGERSTVMETLVGTYIQTGKITEAENFLEDLLADEPKNLRANLLRAAVHDFAGEAEAAEARFRKVIADHPERENGYGALANFLTRQGRQSEADDVIRAGIETAENTVQLMFSRATRLEAAGDFEGAIHIYEQLYDANRVSDVLANNLASLLAEHRTDAESLDRAHNLAKRLRSSKVAAFQDTYGWVLYRRGEYERALLPLRTAAEGLPDNPVVIYHLGMAYAKLDQKPQAVAKLTEALEMAGNNEAFGFLDDARATLEALAD